MDPERLCFRKQYSHRFPDEVFISTVYDMYVPTPIQFRLERSSNSEQYSQCCITLRNESPPNRYNLLTDMKSWATSGGACEAHTVFFSTDVDIYLHYSGRTDVLQHGYLIHMGEDENRICYHSRIKGQNRLLVCLSTRQIERKPAAIRLMGKPRYYQVL